jgi:hypothetical protein
VGLEWGPLSLVSTTEELLERKSRGSGCTVVLNESTYKEKIASLLESGVMKFYTRILNLKLLKKKKKKRE